MQSPREISSERQGALTPATVRLVTKPAVELPESGATPRTLDPAAARQPWANLSVDTAVNADDNGAHLPFRAATAATQATTSAASSMRSGSGSSQVALPAGLLPERYTADLTHWQSPADLPERRLMVQRIIAMTRSKRVDAAAACADARTPSLAKRIELSLYSRAASFHEYRDLNTLRRRLQSLVSLSFHEAAVSRRRAAALMSCNGPVTAVPQLGKRKCRPMTPFGVSRLMIKRPRAECIGSTSTCTPRTTARMNEEAAFFIMDEAILGQVFGHLPGQETIRCMQLNRFARRVLPRCVFTLEVELRQLQLAYTLHAAAVPTQPSATLLCQFPNLTSLTVYNSMKPLCDQLEAGPALHAWGCSELDISHDNAGEEVVQQLAEGIELGACRRLTCLRLVSVFTNTCRGNALHLLCAALVKGSCPDLEDLLLGGNGFSDVGTVDVAWLLKVGSLPKLARLDIRRNYIGESGLKRIMAALRASRCQQLKYLCMGGNIITDNCVAPVVELLSSAQCPQMRFLGLEDNFLSARGVQCIIQAAVAGGMMPKLHHVSCDGTLGDDDTHSSVRAA
ncbi:hypothetical protein PF005_g357 [Phytophthora fragariae]|uniref:Uncharacterized protein n=1 Tax=Phytophthora fragariae TaxID=53985 RepID=A0A6A3SYB5_9STRA|nr:hypothetical protein PF003_g12485 [Phytophthora fragariae]KAE8943200.1 hypothetical protein PF009_g7056 [Phytophthora fragariae]KAE9019685.1 hypothetical protein PF011_g5738 [Phytophthora fragariae]KAE9126067.1 hypothetical protein PF007_g6125 [Phytophthora fragariae]KAE9140111.1 hypothetical protein PF010_g294 [Phytophthora fragariae]